MFTIVTHEFLSKRGDQIRQRYPQNSEGFEHGHSKDSFQVNYISQIFVKKIHHEYYSFTYFFWPQAFHWFLSYFITGTLHAVDI